MQRTAQDWLVLGHLTPNNSRSAQKKGRCCQRPEFREETPKKGYDTATPIAISQCTIYAAMHKTQEPVSCAQSIAVPQTSPASAHACSARGLPCNERPSKTAKWARARA